MHVTELPRQLRTGRAQQDASTAAGLRTVARRCTWLLTGVASCAALAGLLIDGVYAGAASTAAMFRGFDLVTALLVVPVLAASAWRARHGSVLAELVATSMVAYLVYTYAYFLFGTGFNRLFLLHAATFAVGLVTLVSSLVAIDADAVAHRFAARTRVRPISGILGTLSVALGGMWVYVAVGNAVTGEVPTGSQLVESDIVVHLGMALDLAVLVPLYAVAALLLWRRLPWGFLAAAVALFSGVAHQVAYMVAMPFQVWAGVPGAVSYDPTEPVIVVLYLAGAGLLVLGARGHSAGR